MYLQIATQIKPVLNSWLSPQSMLWGLESEWRPSRRLCDEGDDAAVVESGGGGAADTQDQRGVITKAERRRERNDGVGS